MGNSDRRTVVIGIGNPDRGDDAAGRMAARLLRDTLPGEVAVVEKDGEATSLLSSLEGVAAAYLIDASTSASSAGLIRRFDVGAVPLPQGAFNASSHALGLSEALALARVLGQMPETCVVYTIEAQTFEPGAPLSPCVDEAVKKVCEMVRDEIAAINQAGRQIDA